MSSRMEKYYKNELLESGRSKKNKTLYQKISDLDGYTNIEGVATIEKTNEIDISKVKEMLQNRENYKKQKQYKNIINNESNENKEPPVDEEEIKNYDLNEMLSKIKETDCLSREHRSLSNEQYNLLQKAEKMSKLEEEEEEIKELINTMTAIQSNTNDIGLFDDLKSNTTVGDASSIKKIIEEEKKERIIENTSELDKSFYTSSFGFTSHDFEELKDMNHKIKKSNKFIIVLLIILLVIVVVFGFLFFIK